MSSTPVDDIQRLVAPLLQTLEALAHLARHLHPPNFSRVLAGVGTPDAELRAARAMPAWPDPYSAMRPNIDQAADEALAAFDGLRDAATAPQGLQVAYRALRHVPRALEALYPLAGILPPVNRFFLDAERRQDNDFQARFLQPAPEGTGVMCIGDDPKARNSVWVYVPETYTPDTTLPLAVCLHGGSGRGRAFLWSWIRDARSRGAIVVAPTSLGETWAISGNDVDTPHLAHIVDFVRGEWNIDPQRMLLTGMSDGGTFTYTSGLEAGSPFTHLAPVSAAFHPVLVQMADSDRIRGLPIHIAHGSLDWMFPVDMAREAERYFRAAGAVVTFREVEDLSHTYPADLNGAMLDWMNQSRRA
jgi:phospholipase/carboxylesterase